MQLEHAGSAKRWLEMARLIHLPLLLLVFSFSPSYLSVEAALCCRRERLVKRSRKVHGEARAGDDPADMDVGSRPLTTYENCAPVSRRLDPARLPQGWRKVGASDLCSLSPQVQRSDGSRWPGRHECPCHSVLVFLFSPYCRLGKQRFAVGESDLWSEVKKFTVKRRPKTTLPTWMSAAGL